MDSVFTETTVFVFTLMVYIAVKYETAAASAVGKKAIFCKGHFLGKQD